MSKYIKQTGKQRRAAQDKRQNVYVSTQHGKDASKKLADKIIVMNAGQLAKFEKRSVRRAATAGKILETLHKDSMFRPAVERDQRFNIVAALSAKSEAEYRARPLNEKLKIIRETND
jgi:ABC-type sulfate/molybdate transport systems ATPase subunit